MSNTWILVADSARARVFSLRTGTSGLEEIAAYANPDARVPAHALPRARRPERVHDRFGTARHAIEPRTALQDKHDARFAGLLGSVLADGLAARQCGRLALIAPPRFLGKLNAALGDDVQAAVVLKVAKNLTRRGPATILGEIPAALRRRRRNPASVG